MTGVPDWAMEAAQPGPVSLLDIVLEVCRTFRWTTEQVLDMPVRRFWRTVDWIRRRTQERTQAVKTNPIGAMAMMAEGNGDL